MEVSRQECWSELPFPSPVGLPDQGLNLGLLHCRQMLYPLSHQGSPHPVFSLVQVLWRTIPIPDLPWNLLRSFCTGCLFHSATDISASNTPPWMLIFKASFQFSCSVVSDSLQSHRLQASLSTTNCQSLLKLMLIESGMPSNHLILCRPLLLPPLIFHSIRVFSSESVLHIRWPKYWSFSFSISPSNEYSRLISFTMDFFDLLAVQGTLTSPLLSLLYGPALTSINGYWKNHSFD